MQRSTLLIACVESFASTRSTPIQIATAISGLLQKIKRGKYLDLETEEACIAVNVVAKRHPEFQDECDQVAKVLLQLEDPRELAKTPLGKRKLQGQWFLDMA